MADVTLSGYKASATSVTFSGTQTLASLGDNEWTDLSNEIDNSTNKYVYMDIELVLASASFSGDDSAVEIYLVPSVDGTNYPNWTGNVTTEEQENFQYYVCSLGTSGSTAAQRMVARSIIMPNGKFKFGVRNVSNVAWAASGNTLKYRPWQFATA